MYLDKNGWEGIIAYDDFLFIDALYYTIITHTTVGYGDILPRWRYWKMMGAIHSLIVFILIVNEITEFHIIRMPGINRLFSGGSKKKNKDNEITVNDSDLELVIEDEDDNVKYEKQASKIIKILRSQNPNETV